MMLPELSEDDRAVLLQLPACVLGDGAPPTYTVRRTDGRVAHCTLRTAIDRLRRQTTEHGVSACSFDEDLRRLQRSVSCAVQPWRSFWDASPEMTDREVRADWRALLAPWASGIELDAAPVRRRPGEPPVVATARSGVIAVPGTDRTVWTLDEMCSPEGMARIRGVGRAGLHVYWRPAPGIGTGTALLIDDVTDEDHPALPVWTCWVQPHAIIQSSRWKSQLIFRVPSELDGVASSLAVQLNRRLGDPGVGGAPWWMRLPGCWNHKVPGDRWCARVLAMGRHETWAAGWLVNEASRLPKPDCGHRSKVVASVPRSVASQVQVQERKSAHLPAPEDVAECRNVEAARFIGQYLARHFGDVDGMWAASADWNDRLPVPLAEAELDGVRRSIIREDMQNHPGRWQPDATPPARRISVRPSAQAGAKSSSASTRSAHATTSNDVLARDPMMEMEIARLAKATTGPVVRASLKTLDACLAAVTEDGRALQFVPEAMKTPDVCAVAVRNDGTALQFVPEKLRTPELCAATVRKDGRALEFVPEALRTPEMYLEAVRGGAWALKLVPDELKTPELCMEAVKANGWALWWVPEELKTEKLCLEAVKQDGLALKHVPDALKTLELCVVAVRGDRQALDSVPDSIRAGVRRAARMSVQADDGLGGPRH